MLCNRLQNQSVFGPDDTRFMPPRIPGNKQLCAYYWHGETCPFEANGQECIYKHQRSSEVDEAKPATAPAGTGSGSTVGKDEMSQLIKMIQEVKSLQQNTEKTVVELASGLEEVRQRQGGDASQQARSDRRAAKSAAAAAAARMPNHGGKMPAGLWDDEEEEED